MKLEDIKRHWEKSGENFPFDDKITPTSRDPFLGELERENILAYLKREHTCLEIGCGDALHTMHYAKKTKRIFGIDIADSLIKIAQKRAKQDSVSNVDFYVGSVLDIADIFKNNKFDRVISQRCLINLPSWEHQINALKQIHQLLHNQGILLLTEGFQDNLDNLNHVRKKFSLSEIKVVDYNRNFTVGDFEKFIQQYFEVIGKHYYGSYLFFSRLYHPLVVAPEDPKHDAKLNEVAMHLQRELTMPDLEKYSYNIAYVLKKRAI